MIRITLRRLHDISQPGKGERTDLVLIPDGDNERYKKIQASGYPKLAKQFGWDGSLTANSEALGDKHKAQMIAAAAFLDNRVGQSINDPGYFT